MKTRDLELYDNIIRECNRIRSLMGTEKYQSHPTVSKLGILPLCQTIKDYVTSLKAIKQVFSTNMLDEVYSRLNELNVVLNKSASVMNIKTTFDRLNKVFWEYQQLVTSYNSSREVEAKLKEIRAREKRIAEMSEMMAKKTEAKTRGHEVEVAENVTSDNFRTRFDKLSKYSSIWLVFVFIGLIASVAWILYVAFSLGGVLMQNSGDVSGTVGYWTFTVLLIMSAIKVIPVFLVMSFLIKRYNICTHLAEIYNFKALTSLTLTGYTKELLDEKYRQEGCAESRSLMLDTLKNLYDDSSIHDAYKKPGHFSGKEWQMLKEVSAICKNLKSL